MFGIRVREGWVSVSSTTTTTVPGFVHNDRHWGSKGRRPGGVWTCVVLLTERVDDGDPRFRVQGVSDSLRTDTVDGVFRWNEGGRRPDVV